MTGLPADSRASRPVGPDNLPTGTPLSIEGIAAHPTQRILYAGLPLGGAIAVFTYNRAGRLTYAGSQPTSVIEPCWILIDREARFLYVSNSQSNTVTVFSIADPLRPVQVQAVVLALPRQVSAEGLGRFNTAPHQITLDPEGERLYVVNHKHSVTNSFPEGNNIHILDIGEDGLLTEDQDPLVFPKNLVPPNGRAQGIVAI